jgi:hypothetical protein
MIDIEKLSSALNRMMHVRTPEDHKIIDDAAHLALAGASALAGLMPTQEQRRK